MRLKHLACASTSALWLFAVAAESAHGQNVSDETGPVVTQVSPSPTSINTSSGAQSVTLTVTATDDLSGFNYALVYLRTTATGQAGNQTSFGCYVSSLASGTRMNGTFTQACTVPQYSQSGNWFVYQVTAYDMVGNYQNIYNGGNQLPVAPQVVAVTAPSLPPLAAGAPVLVSLDVSPGAVNVSTGSQTITFTARVTSSDGSFYYGYANLNAPSGGPSTSVYFYSWSNRIAGDGYDGTYRATAVVPRYSRAGEWVWNNAVLYNTNYQYSQYYSAVAGRFASRYSYDGVTYTYTSLGTSGPTLTPATLSVASDPSDTEPPRLVNFALSPSSIDVSTSANTITVTAAASDDLSGFSYGCVLFRSPNQQQSRSACFYPYQQAASLYFPQFSQAGNWALSYLYLYDQLGNYRYLTAADVAALGFSTSLQISSGVEVQNVTGYVDGSVTLTAKLTKLGVPAPGKTLTFTVRNSPAGSAVTDANGVATLENISLAGIPVGTYVNAIVASFAGDADQAAASGQATLMVTNRLSQTITFGALGDRPLSDSPFTVSATASSGLPVSFAATGNCTVSGNAVTLTTAGSCTIVAAQPGNSLYDAASSIARTFTVLTKSDQTITFAAIAGRQYGAAAFGVSATSTSGLTVSFAATGNCTLDGQQVTAGAVGSCQITASQSGNAQYNAAPDVVRVFNITRAPLTVTGDADTTTVANEHFTKTYDGQPYSAYRVRYDGFVNGEGAGVLGGALVFSGPGTTAVSAGGPYSVTPGGVTSGNYAITFVSGALLIARAPLSVTANDTSTILHGPLPALDGEISGFVGSENSSVLGGALTCTTTATATSPIGSYPIGCSGLTSNNYDIRYHDGTLRIQYAAAGTACYGGEGHSILQPINADQSSVFKRGSTVPAKFRVCDANGNSIGNAGVIASFRLVQVLSGTTTVFTETVESTTPDASFRWDPSGQQWVFNISTRPLAANATYVYAITLDDATSIQFRYGLR